MVDRFTSMLDCVEVGFLPDGILDQLPAPSEIAATRVSSMTSTDPGCRAALAATLALAVAPAGFTVAEFTAKVRAMTGQTPEDYSVRQGAYDLRKLRGKQLVIKPGRTRRYHVPEFAARTITALLDPPRQGHRAPHRRHPNTTTRPPTQELDHHRPRLRNPPPQHADPAQRPRHRDQGNGPIDNDLSITSRNPLGMSARLSALSGPAAGTTAR